MKTSTTVLRGIRILYFVAAGELMVVVENTNNSPKAPTKDKIIYEDISVGGSGTSSLSGMNKSAAIYNPTNNRITNIAHFTLDLILLKG